MAAQDSTVGRDPPVEVTMSSCGVVTDAAGRDRGPQAPIELPTEVNLLEAFLPRVVTAAMHTTAMRATSSAYSTSDAPRSLLT